MAEFKAVIDVKSLTAHCPLDPCFIKLILRQPNASATSQVPKLQSKKQLILRNGKVDINQTFQLPVQNNSAKQKVTMIVMASKGKEVSLLGVANIDMKKITCSSPSNLTLPLQKCSDDKAFLNLSTRLHQKHNLSSQQTSDIEKLQFKQNTRNQQKSSMSFSRSNNSVEQQAQFKLKQDLDCSLQMNNRSHALQISRKNFKHSQIIRDEKNRSLSKDSTGSYKRRFEYQQNLTNNTSKTIITCKKKPSQKQPVARKKIPEPIQSQSLSKHRQTSKPKFKQGSFSYQNHKHFKTQSAQHLIQQQQPKAIHSNASPTKIVRFADQQPPGTIKHQRSSSLKKQRYALLADKLQQIQQRIQREKNSTESNSYEGESQMQVSPERKRYPADSIQTFVQTQQWGTRSRTNQSDPSMSIKTSIDFIKELQIYRQKIQELIQEDRKKQRKIDELEDEKLQNEKLVEKLAKLYQSAQQQTPSESTQKLFNAENQINRWKQQALKWRQQATSLQTELQLLKSQRSALKQQNIRIKNQLSEAIKPLPKNSSQSDLLSQLQKQKRKVINLSSQVKFKQNQLKFIKLNQQSLQNQKRQLQNELRKLQNKHMVRKQSRAELQKQFLGGYPTALRSQNKLLRQQVDLLQRHNTQLNTLLQNKDGSNPNLNLPSPTTSSPKIQQKDAQISKLRQLNTLLQAKCQTLKQKSQALEQNLVRTKANFCQAMNAALQRGGEQLVQFLQSNMTLDK